MAEHMLMLCSLYAQKEIIPIPFFGLNFSFPSAPSRAVKVLLPYSAKKSKFK